MTDPFANLCRELTAANVAFVVTGVWGANYYAKGKLFVTQDQDLFLPRSAANLHAAWNVCLRLGLELTAGEEPLDQPRDITLAESVVRASALTTASDGNLLLVDLSLVMSGLTFEEVASRRRVFRSDGVEIPVASLVDIVAAKHSANRPKDRLFLASHQEEIVKLLREIQP